MLIESSHKDERVNLNSPVQVPNAATFLWNRSMMIQMNCRGYATAQFMQPEPSKYAHAPMLEAKTFMQPEQVYYAHHPGRFFYIKDELSQEHFSIPFEPVRKMHDRFIFSAGLSDISWEIWQKDLKIELCVTLAKDDVLELWRIKISNTGENISKLSLYPYFPVGYMSWMNQSGKFLPHLNGIICSSISPYQKYQDYYQVRNLKDKTFLIADKKPTAWEVNQAAFEGEGGLHYPSGIQKPLLEKGDALYETPACIMQYQVHLSNTQNEEWRFLFGPARNEQEVQHIRQRYFIDKRNETDGFEWAVKEYAMYIKESKGCIRIKTPDFYFDHFVNYWLPRQIFYHGETNRLCTDPQTRNYLQDHMGMSYIKPQAARDAFLTALRQQKENGAMPEGILIHQEAELKYINQVPHNDHCVWLPICLKAYLDETNDFGLLDEWIPFADGKEATVSEHINRAMRWLSQNRDDRGLSYINQGDWCDPMNMVGHKGKGVSGWLTMASSYALQVWVDISQHPGISDLVDSFRATAMEMNNAINLYLWDGKWYGRGITDDHVVFGISDDKEGRIFLNVQGWAFLCGCADEAKTKSIMQAVECQLETPYGLEILAPSFTTMREDIGRLTQKHPGSAENGSVYNHATAFYIYGLYSIGENEAAYRLLRKMIPGPDDADLIQRGQMPVYIPNYYRGAYKQFPRTAGRSSQLFNTGSVHWVYRSLIDGLLGLQGNKKGLKIHPQLPSDWNEVNITRRFRKAEFNITMKRIPGLSKSEVELDGKILTEPIIEKIVAYKTYRVIVKIPFDYSLSR